MKTKLIALALATLIFTQETQAFCGFYVSQAPANLWNHKSEVILVRDGHKTVITMSNDFQGDVSDFAMVVPVPVVLREDQIKVVDRGIFDRLDAYSAPRLVEYYDNNPCFDYRYAPAMSMSGNSRMVNEQADMEIQVSAKKNKVVIEASYTVGEYDILILSAKESDGLENWLRENNYRIPAKASEILRPYVLSNTKFFVVKVNLDKQKESGFDYLRPISIRFESEKFMLPIRLGMANAQDAQDLVVYAFTKEGRVELTNYRTVKIATDRKVPLFVESYFGAFYKDLFDRSYHRERESAVFLEYAWNVSPMNGVKCDPCVSPPPVFDDFAEAGVDWVSGMNTQSNVFFTRLHVRYTRDKFPQDLQFQVTPNRENFQARYIMHHPAEGDLGCAAGASYRAELENRRKLEVEELASLVGWTNPNYQDYIKEFSITNRPDKYAPNREDFMPAFKLPSDKSSGDRGKFILFLFAAAGLLVIRWFQWRQSKFLKIM